METCVVSLAGADLGAERDDGRSTSPRGAAHRLPAGALVRFAGSPGPDASVPRARRRDRRSRCARVGVDDAARRPRRRGRARAPGRRPPGAAPPWGPPAPPGARGPPLPRRTRPTAGSDPLRPGPDLHHLPADVTAGSPATTWTVGRASDRMGIRLVRLAPAARPRDPVAPRDCPGRSRSPADGRPIVLLVDGPTIGGYPVAGVVARAELPRLGQARPGDVLRLAPQDAADARAAWRQRRRSSPRWPPHSTRARPGLTSAGRGGNRCRAGCPAGGRGERPVLSFAAFFAGSAIRTSSAGVSSVSAKAVGHVAPS